MVLLDSIIAGIQPLNVAGSSNVVLTFVNGAASQTNNAIFNCTGLLTGNVVVLFPAGKNKVIIFQNNTTGAFTLSAGVNNGSGSPAGATVSVAAGASAILVSDGTNVTNATGAFFINPTFSGTATFPDAATWTSGGISNLTALGIGMVPVNVLDITQNQNGGSLSAILNNNAGSNAFAGYQVKNGTSVGYFIQYGAGTVGSAFDSIANSTLLRADGAGGLCVGTGVSAPIRFGVGDSYVGGWGTDGSFLVGSSANAGAGVIAATGDIKGFVSDDRLKTKLGPIDSALSKVLSLNVFYWSANKTFQELDKNVSANRRHIGLSAQEVQRILPEVVTDAPIGHGYLTIMYDKMIPASGGGHQRTGIQSSQRDG